MKKALKIILKTLFWVSLVVALLIGTVEIVNAFTLGKLYDLIDKAPWYTVWVVGFFDISILFGSNYLLEKFFKQ